MKQTQNIWENLILLDTPWATAPFLTKAADTHYFSQFFLLFT